MPKYRNISIKCGARGFIARPDVQFPGLEGDLFAFDRITDLATWLVEQFPGETPSVTPDPIRGQACVSDHATETDERQGDTFVQHAVLDLAGEMRTSPGHMSSPARIDWALEKAAGALKQGLSQSSVELLINAAAQLMAAAESYSAALEGGAA